MSVEGVIETIRAGDRHISEAPLENTEDAVRSLDVNELIVRAARLLSDLNTIRNTITATLELGGESDVQVSSAILEYSEAVMSSDKPAALRLQKSTGILHKSIADMQREVQFLIPNIEDAMKAVGSASMLLTACEGHYVEAIAHAEAATAVRPVIVEASNEYKQQIMGDSPG